DHAEVNGHAPVNGHGSANGHGTNGVQPAPHFGHHPPRAEAREPVVKCATTARDKNGVVRYYRHDLVVTGWQIKAEQAGRIKLKNAVLYRKRELCEAIERELM